MSVSPSRKLPVLVTHRKLALTGHKFWLQQEFHFDSHSGFIRSKMWTLKCLFAVVALVEADIYLHNPR